MYKTVTVWVQGKVKKLTFNRGVDGNTGWISIDDNSYSGNASFHFSGDGLKLFISELQKLERDMIKAKKEEVKVK